MDVLWSIFLVIIIYFAACLLTAGIRSLFFRKGFKKQGFRSAFWSFFLELINPVNWL